MNWLLIFIGIPLNGMQYSEQLSSYKDMESCFADRELIVEKLGRPIVNYQVICVPSTRGE